MKINDITKKQVNNHYIFEFILQIKLFKYRFNSICVCSLTKIVIATKKND